MIHEAKILAPFFPRLTEYFGVWAMHASHATALWDLVTRTDMTDHVRKAMDDDHDDPPEPKSQIERLSAGRGQTVAVVPVLGTLMKQRSSFGGTSTIQIRRDIRMLAADPDISAILLAIESPGGVAAGTDDLAADIRSARRKKPVWAHVDDLAASAAYWVASSAGQIFANSNTALIGSIGTMLTVYDVSERAGKDGVKAMLFATGPLKGAGTPGTAITPEQQTYFQGLVDSMQKEFDRGVRLGRNLSERELMAVRTGGVFDAQEAIRLKLIDGIRPLEKTIDALADAASQRKQGTR